MTHILFSILICSVSSLAAMDCLSRKKAPAIQTFETKRKTAEGKASAESKTSEFITLEITVHKGVRQCRALFGNTGETMLFVYIMNMSTSDEPKVRADYLEKIKAIIKTSKDLNQQDKRGDTPLVYAINAGATDVALELISAGPRKVDINKACNRGMTPLMSATVQQNEVVIKALINEEVDMYRVDENGDDALKYVCKAIGHNKDVDRNWGIIRMLLTSMPHGGWWPNKAGQYRHDFLIKNERYELFDAFVRTLRYEKIDKIAKAHSILDRIIELDMVEFFLTAMHVDYDGSSALLVAAQEGSLDLVNRLIDLGADVNICNISGSSPLWVALYYKTQWPIAKRLIEAGADVLLWHKRAGKAPIGLFTDKYAEHFNDNSPQKLELVDLLEKAAKRQAEQKLATERAVGAAPADTVEGLGLA